MATVYFNDQAELADDDGNMRNLANYFDDEADTIPSMDLPTTTTDLVMQSGTNVFGTVSVNSLTTQTSLSGSADITTVQPLSFGGGGVIGEGSGFIFTCAASLNFDINGVTNCTFNGPMNVMNSGSGSLFGSGCVFNGPMAATGVDFDGGGVQGDVVMNGCTTSDGGTTIDGNVEANSTQITCGDCTGKLTLSQGSKCNLGYSLLNGGTYVCNDASYLDCDGSPRAWSGDSLVAFGSGTFSPSTNIGEFLYVTMTTAIFHGQTTNNGSVSICRYYDRACPGPVGQQANGRDAFQNLSRPRTVGRAIG